jgi:hypothetical protein
MSSDDYAGRGTLPPELDQRVRSELSGGERLVWVGQPRPRLYRGQIACMTLFGLFFLIPPAFMLLFAVAMAAGVLGAGGPAEAFGFFPLCFGLFTIPFFLVGGLMAAASVWMPRRLRRVAYALTDRRALIWEPGFFGRYTVRSYTPASLSRLTRVDRGDGAGDLVFEEYYTAGTNSQGFQTTQRNQRGFLAVDRVREVEELMRLTLSL